MGDFPQDPFHIISSSRSNSYAEGYINLKFPVLGRWFLSVGPTTQQTHEAAYKIPASDGSVASQRAAIGSTGQRAIKASRKDTDSRDSAGHLHWSEGIKSPKQNTRLNGRWEAVQGTFPLDALWDRAKRDSGAKKGLGARTAHGGKNRTIKEMIRPEGKAARNILSSPEHEILQKRLGGGEDDVVEATYL